MALPCGHALCEADASGASRAAPCSSMDKVSALSRPTEEAQDLDARRQRREAAREDEDAAARREAVERSRREAAEERERRAAVARSRRAPGPRLGAPRATRRRTTGGERVTARRRVRGARRGGAPQGPPARGKRQRLVAHPAMPQLAVNQRMEHIARRQRQWFTGMAHSREDCKTTRHIYVDDAGDRDKRRRIADSPVEVSTPHTGTISNLSQRSGEKRG